MPDIQTTVFGAFEGRSMSPDVLLTQEILSTTAMNTFLGALNSAPGSSGTWAAGPFIDGNDTDGAIFYRSDRLTFEGATVVSTGGGAPLPPRNTVRYDVRLKGFLGVGPKVALYNCHMKSGSTSSDVSRRLAEAFAVRNNAQALTGFDGFAIAGDFNTPASSDDAYDKLIGSESNNAGRFYDPISTPGNWNNNSAFRYVHTQDPSANGGMDSRFDFLLLSNSLTNGAGFDYIGAFGVPYSTTSWNDMNHSYRAWGNDGTSYGQTLTVSGNAMVGSAIAQAIKNAATASGGHIPVFLDLRAPAELGVSTNTLDFGNVVQGSAASLPVMVTNTTDPVIWRTGIANLLYTLSSTAGFTAPAGTFTDPAGGVGNNHQISVDTSSLGPKSGTLTVAGEGSRAISLIANVIPDMIAPTSMSLSIANLVSGGILELASSDDQRVNWRNANWYTGGRLSPVAELEVVGTSSLQNPTSLTFELEASTAGSFSQEIRLYDFVASQFVLVSTTNSTPFDSTVVANAPNPARFVQAGTKQMKARVTLTPSSWSLGRVLTGGFDRAVWKPR